MSDPSYHIPVLLKESVDGLNVVENGTYVDVTYGGGGHTAEILKRLGSEGKVFAFDQDVDAIGSVPKDERLVFINKNFRYMKNYLKLYDAIPVDGVLADLGVASHHFEGSGRGFSIRKDEPLDMRMDKRLKKTADDIVRTYSKEELIRIFRNYGELKNAPKVAGRIVNERESKRSIDGWTSGMLRELIEPLAPPRKENQFLAQVFQALRIEVNRELEALMDFLKGCGDVLRPGGRLSVIAYHSLEDRLVKNYIKKGKFRGEVDKDMYGNPLAPFEQVNRKLIVPSEEEVKQNNRARSAKLRIAQKV